MLPPPPPKALVRTPLSEIIWRTKKRKMNKQKKKSSPKKRERTLPVETRASYQASLFFSEFFFPKLKSLEKKLK